MTDGHAVIPHDPEASLRAELSAKIAGAQLDIESKLTELRNALASAQNGLAITQADSQLRGLSTLQQRISMANASGLSAIRGEVAATIAATQALVQQAQTGASTSQSAQVALTQASEAARNNVKDFMHAYYDEHKFDSYLHFASTEDEAEYRKREQERKQAIDKALAEHTPEGNLQANQLSIEQLKDAGAHGADRSPDYKPTLDGLTASEAKLKTQIDQKAPSQTLPATTKTTSSIDPAAALKAAGVSLADANDAAHSVPRDGSSQRVRT